MTRLEALYLYRNCTSLVPSMQAPREGLVSYVAYLGPQAISLHENGRLESDWSPLNKYIILTHHDS